MRQHLSVWVIEFIKLVGRRRLYPLVTQCPVCQQMVRLHVNEAGRRHVFAHARVVRGVAFFRPLCRQVQVRGLRQPKTIRSQAERTSTL
jgi:hypothetical protein